MQKHWNKNSYSADKKKWIADTRMKLELDGLKKLEETRGSMKAIR